MHFTGKRFVISLVILIGLAGLLIYITGAVDFIPRERVSAKSPDGKLRVVVYQQRLSLRPFFPRMRAVVRVYDSEERLVLEKTIFHDDDWDDTLGDAYRTIGFVDDEIHIGPEVYRRESNYIIRRSDLWNLPN